MTLGDRLRRALGPDGVMVARKAVAKPRRLARRLLDTPSGEEYGQLATWSDEMLTEQQAMVVRTQLEVAAVERRFDDFEDYQGARWSEAEAAIQRHLVQVEDLVRSLERLKTDVSAELEAITARLLAGDARLDEIIERISRLTAATHAETTALADEASEARGAVRSLRRPAR